MFFCFSWLSPDQSEEVGITITEETRDLLSNVDLDLRTATEIDVKEVISEVGGSYINESQAMMHVQEMLIKYSDLTVDDFEIHQPDNEFLTEELNTNLNEFSLKFLMTHYRTFTLKF